MIHKNITPMKTCFRVLLLITALVNVRCGDFLSESPDNRSELNSKEKLAELLVTAYPEASYITFCEAMSDNVQDNAGAAEDQRNADPYFWRDGSSTDQDSPEYYWNACYTAIASANHALEFIAAAEAPSLYNAQKGEALVARAYSHFMLVSLFSRIYDPNTAAADAGIPYVTTPEKESFGDYERKTVQYVYEMIEKDLTEGLPLIDDLAYAQNESSSGVPKYHFTQAAAHAFATRFYLFKKDYRKVIEHANLVFPSGDFTSNLRPWNTTYKTYSASELMINYTKASEPANLLLCETLSEWARSYGALRYATGATRFQEILSNNPAGGEYAYSAYYSSTGVFFVNKFKEHFVRVGTNASTGYPYTIVPLFTAEEVLLNRAEAYVMMNQFTNAINDLNVWVSTRITNYNGSHQLYFEKLADYYSESSTSQQVVLSAILAFRRVEFLHEGLRWFDILRHNIPVEHRTFEGETMVLKRNDLRRTLQLPREVIALGKLSPNPR
jgi:hypothetical protein